MRSFILRKSLLLVPVVILVATLLFLNYTIEFFKDTSYDFVFDTNVESIRQFENELALLTGEGYAGNDYYWLYTSMIRNFYLAMGMKEAVITFIIDAEEEIHHNGGYSEKYLSGVFDDDDNMAVIDGAIETQNDGNVVLKRNGKDETFFFHRFYSGPDNYYLFMTVDRAAIEEKINVAGIVIPISVVGLLLFIVNEYAIWMRIECLTCNRECAVRAKQG